MSDGPDGGHDAVVMLAAAVVLAFGAAFCSLMILFVAENSTTATWVTIGALTGCVAIIGLLLMDPDPKRRGGIWARIRRFFGRKDPKTQYKAKQRVKMKVVEFGTNKPPSVESVREIKESTDGMKNWSPKSTPKEQDESLQRIAAG